MLLTLFPIVTLVRLAQPEKVKSSILVTLFPMVTLERLVQKAKALPSILVTLLGTVLQFSHAYS
jgi:hypothetical protein